MITTRRIRRRGPLALSVLLPALALATGCGQAPRPSPDTSASSPSAQDGRPEAVAHRVGDAAGKGEECCRPGSEVTPAEATPGPPRPISIPDVALLDQDGKEVRFFSDLVKGKIVAINFVFTRCTTACPLNGASFAKLRKKLGDRLETDFALISISVDPVVDRPDRLKAWAKAYEGGPGWILVTSAEGRKSEVDTLLKALQAYSPDKSNHTQSVLVVDGNSLEGWSSRSLASPVELEQLMARAFRTRGGRSYFTDTTLIDQDGHRLRFYSDLVKGKVVVIHAFFTACKGVCPVMVASLAKLQDRLGERLGRDVVILSLTVDPANDTRENLADYARRGGVRPGWHFLSGEKPDVARVLAKLGQSVENRDGHSPIIFVGNEATGTWMKHPNPADAEGLIAKVEEALANRPAPTDLAR